MKKTVSAFALILGFVLLLTSGLCFSASPDLEIFEKMLEINTATPEDFGSNQRLIEAAAVALRDEADDEGYISRSKVDSFMFNMYGINSADMTVETYGLPEKEGHIFLIGRGLDLQDTEVLSLDKVGNEIKAQIKVTVYPHDDEPYTVFGVATFKKNDASCYGYNLLGISEGNKAI